MAKIINLGTAIVSQLAVEDGDGNALPIQTEPIPIMRPGDVDSRAEAWERWEARMRALQSKSAEDVAALFASAEQQARGEQQAASPVNRGARRQAARSAVREQMAPANGRLSETAAKVVEVAKE